MFLSPLLAQLGALKETHWIVLPAATQLLAPGTSPARSSADRLHTRAAASLGTGGGH